MTFNLKTGEIAVLPDLFLDMSKASLERLVKEEVKTYIKENPNRSWFDDAEETVDAYDIDEMKYVIQGSKVFVLFDTYELAPGMSGLCGWNFPLHCLREKSSCGDRGNVGVPSCTDDRYVRGAGRASISIEFYSKVGSNPGLSLTLNRGLDHLKTCGTVNKEKGFA